MKLGVFVALLCAGAAVPACDSEGSADGARGPCASPAGELVGCEPGSIETPEDACFRLVDCAAIPIEAEENLDWGDCVDILENFSADRYDFAIACIEASSCDELRPNGGPSTPFERTLCLQHGGQ
jgi:hypothetical protein